MDRRFPATLEEDEAGTLHLQVPHQASGYTAVPLSLPRPLSDAGVGAEVLVEAGGGLWRAAYVEAPRGFLCKEHQERLVPGPRGLFCPRCANERRAQRRIEAGASMPGEQTPGIVSVTGYAWLVGPVLFGEQPAWGGEYLGETGSGDHLVVTPGPRPPEIPGMAAVAFYPLGPCLLVSDRERPAFAVKAAGPVETIDGAEVQRWHFGIGC